MDYEEIKQRLTEDFELVERNKSRKQAIEQNGNDGLVYLVTDKYWNVCNDHPDYFFHLANGDYKVFPSLEFKIIFKHSTLASRCDCWHSAIDKIMKHYTEANG